MKRKRTEEKKLKRGLSGKLPTDVYHHIFPFLNAKEASLFSSVSPEFKHAGEEAQALSCKQCALETVQFDGKRCFTNPKCLPCCLARHPEFLDWFWSIRSREPVEVLNPIEPERRFAVPKGLSMSVKWFGREPGELTVGKNFSWTEMRDYAEEEKGIRNLVETTRKILGQGHAVHLLVNLRFANLDAPRNEKDVSVILQLNPYGQVRIDGWHYEALDWKGPPRQYLTYSLIIPSLKE